MSKKIINHGASYIRNDGDLNRCVDKCPECGSSTKDIEIYVRGKKDIAEYTCNYCRCVWEYSRKKSDIEGTIK